MNLSPSIPPPAPEPGLLLSHAENHPGEAAGILAAAVFLLFARVLFSGNLLLSTVEGDLANQFYGWRLFGFSELAKGHLALWNPYVFCGAPYFAGFQSALLYPPNWLFLLLPLVFALNFSIALHVFLAGFFTFRWLAFHRLPFLPALFGSFVFMFGGAFFLHVYPGHLTNLCAMAWIPLVFLQVDRILENPGLRNILLAAGVLSLQLLSGHPQYFLYTLFLAALYAAGLFRKGPSGWGRKVSAGFSCLTVALALTALQWLPAWEAAGEFGRDLSANSGDPVFFSLSPLGLVSILAPSLFGTLDPAASPGNGRIWWEMTPYIGAVAFLFALNALRGGGWFRNRVPLGLALLSVLLALGHHTFLYPLLEKIPPFHFFRGSFKFLVLFQAFAAFLAARGLEAWLRETLLHKTLFRGTLLLSLAGALSLWGFAFSHLPDFPVENFQEEGRALQAAVSPSLGDGRIFWNAHNDRSFSLGLPDIWGDDPLVPRRLAAWLAFGNPASPPPTADSQVLNLTPAKAALTRLAFLVERKAGHFQATPSPFPRLRRALLVNRWKGAPGPREAMEEMSRPGFDPATEVLLEEEPNPEPDPKGQRGRVALTDLSTDLIEVSAQTGKPVILLITDQYSRGWKALALPDSVQKSYRVLPGDVFARAIPLSAGQHHFVLKYEAPGFLPGLWVSLGAFFLYWLGWGWVWKRRA